MFSKGAKVAEKATARAYHAGDVGDCTVCQRCLGTAWSTAPESAEHLQGAPQPKTLQQSKTLQASSPLEQCPRAGPGFPGKQEVLAQILRWIPSACGLGERSGQTLHGQGSGASSPHRPEVVLQTMLLQTLVCSGVHGNGRGNGPELSLGIFLASHT